MGLLLSQPGALVTLPLSLLFDHKVMALATNLLANFGHDSDIPLARSHSLMWLAVEKTLEIP